MTNTVFPRATFSRATTAIVPAAIITALTFYCMTLLITAEFEIPEPTKTFIIDIVKPFEMTDIPEPPLPESPPEPVAPPQPPKAEIGGTIPIGFEAEPIKLPGLEPGGLQLSDGTYLPLVQVQPAYPRRAMSRGIEGYTIVEFDITKEGLVKDPRIIEAHPSPVFNAASIAAIQKFKFKPRVEDGNPVTVYGARNKFRFELEGN